MGSVEINNWYAFLLLPIPLLMYLFFPKVKRSRVIIKFSDIGFISNDNRRKRALNLQQLLLVLIWFILILIISQPSYRSPSKVIYKSDRNVVFALDLSESMATNDMNNSDGKPISRIQSSKEIIEEYVLNSKNDRLALIVFGKEAFLQSPFTDDYSAWINLLNELELGMAGSGTNIGDAIGVAIKLFRNETNNSSYNKTLIIFTDGNDTGSIISPIEAAKIAELYGVKIHVVIVGDVTSSESSYPVDVELINRVTDITDGYTFVAENKSDLDGAYKSIREIKANKYRLIVHGEEINVYLYLCFLMLIFICFIIRSVKR